MAQLGDQFGQLTLLEEIGVSSKHKKAYWLCRCVCGNKKVIRLESMKKGSTTSCGCLRKNKAKIREMIPIKDRVLVRRINEFAKQSKTSPTTWVEEVLEDWIREHRSGKFIEDMDRHTARNEDTSWDQFTDVFSPGDIMEVVT